MRISTPITTTTAARLRDRRTGRIAIPAMPSVFVDDTVEGETPQG